MNEEIKRAVENISDQLTVWRRDFHRHPEVAFQEERTSAVLRGFLESLGLPVKTMAKTGLRAVLEGKKGGKTVALRADIDALPLQEEGDKEYISLNPGAAHACAHDGHMACVMGAVKVLTQMRDRFDGSVVFLFQPSEELPPGGAKPMVEEGALEGVDAIFGLHFWQSLPTGKVGIVKGPMMAQADNFTIKVTGKGGHGSMPHTSIDPIYAAAQIIVNAQSVVSRNVDPLKPVVVSFGTIKGGTVYNIIPGEVIMTGTVRTFESDVQDLAERRLREISGSVALSLGAEADFEYEKGYPPLVNQGEMTDFVTATAKNVLGEDCIGPFDPIMGGEDFAYFLQRVPGAFFFFGMGDGMDHPHHHPSFDMDERALPQATHLLIRLAVDFLGRNRAAD